MWNLIAMYELWIESVLAHEIEIGLKTRPNTGSSRLSVYTGSWFRPRTSVARPLSSSSKYSVPSRPKRAFTQVCL